MDILKIADFVEDPTAPQWEDYPGLQGFRVLIRLPDIPADARLMAQAIKIDMDKSEPQPKIKDVEWAAYHHNLLRYVVTDWQGLTVGGLKLMFPGQRLMLDGAKWEQEIGYSPENRDFLLEKSAPFVRWLNDVLQRRQQDATRQEEEDEKN